MFCAVMQFEQFLSLLSFEWVGNDFLLFGTEAENDLVATYFQNIKAGRLTPLVQITAVRQSGNTVFDSLLLW